MEQRKQFIEKHKNEIISVCKGTGLFPSVMMAQAIIESAGRVNGVYLAGESILAKKYNNFFGIKKGVNWNGKTVTLNTPKDGQPVSVFRAYDSVKQGFADRVNFLKANPRYAKNGVFSAKNYIEQCNALQKAGYAEATNYATMLISMINAYGLSKLDSTTILDNAKEIITNKGLLLILAFCFFGVLLTQTAFK